MQRSKETETSLDSGSSTGHVSTLKFIGGTLVGIAVLGGTIFAMGGRPENVDLSPETPSAEESARQALAVQAHQIAVSSDALLDDVPDSEALTQIRDVATSYEQQLGGVWVPWPSGAPSGYTNPALDTDAPADVSSESLLEALQDFSQSTLGLSTTSNADDRPVLLSMNLGSRLLGATYAESVGSDLPMCGDVDVALAAKAAATSDVVGVADASRQWLETDAAQTSADSRDAQINRIDSLNAFIEVVLLHDGTDDREAFVAYPEVSDGETYTHVALDDLSASLLSAASSSSSLEESDSIISYGCSLYLTPEERSAALPFPGIEPAK